MTRTLLAFAVGSWLLAPVAHAQRENDPERCANGVDDDGDLLVDCDDSGCRRLTVCTGERAPERGEAACHNGADDDGDGMVDCADDGCAELCGAAHLGARPAPDQESVRFFDDEPEEEPRRVFPMGWAERPMTYHEGMLVPQLGSLFEESASAAAFASFGQGAAGLTYGIVDFLQVTVVPVAFLYEPVVEYGSPAVSATVRFFEHEVVELGAFANVVIPLSTLNASASIRLPATSFSSQPRTTDDTMLDGSLRARLHVLDILRIDLDLPMVSVLFIDVPTLAPQDPQVWVSFLARVGFSITDYAFAGTYTGVKLGPVVYDQPEMAVGFFAGAVLPGPSARGPLGDITVRFGWPRLFDARRPRAELSERFWQLSVDVRFFTFLLP